MMKIALFLTALAAPFEEKRLISLREGHAESMTTSKIFNLIKSRTHFIDVTDGEWEILSSNPPSFAESLFPMQVTKVNETLPMIDRIDGQYIKTFLDEFSAFNNRYYDGETGKLSAEFLWTQLTKIKQETTRTDVEIVIEKVEHEWKQFSIIARLQSVVPVRQDRVIIGAHQDSINRFDPIEGRAPGYDDDGTGCANVLYTLKLLTENVDFVPIRPIEFHFYAGEERGLLGSQKVVAKYVQEQVPVYVYLNNDMSGYPNQNATYALVVDNASVELTSVLRSIATQYTTMPIVEHKCFYGCSDHASWTRAGFPAAFHHEASARNPFIHSTDDVFDNISLEHTIEFLKATIGFVVEMSLYE